MARFWPDPSRERALEAAADEYQRRMEALDRIVTAQRAQQVALMAQTYPTMSSQLAQGVTAAGAEGVNSTLAALVTREARVVEGEKKSGGVWGWLTRNIGGGLATARDAVFNTAKAGLRGFFLGAEGAWEELLARPFRTGVAALTQGRTDFANLYNEAGNSALTLAIQDLMAGREVNVGSGFLPGSDNPTETDRYEELIEQGMSEEEARLQVEEEIGRPVTEISRQQAETLRFRGQPISPGRVLAGVFVEPGTKPYHLLSGLVDAAARLALDPTARTLRGLSFARKGAKMFGAVETVPGEAGTAGLAARNFAAGLIPGVRKTVRAQSVDAWLAGKDGRRVCEVVANTTGDDAFSLIKDLLQRGNPTSVNRHLIADLVKETDPQKVSAILRPHLGRTVLEKPVNTTLWGQLGLPSLSRGVGGAVAGDWGQLGGFGVAVKHRVAGTILGRVFEKMPGRHIRLEDMDDGLNDLDDFMVSAGFGAARRSGYLADWANLKTGDYTGAYKVMKDVMHEVEDDLVKPVRDAAGMIVKNAAGEEVYKGIPRILARRVTRMFDDTQTMRQYFTTHIGTPGWFPGVETVDMGGQHVVMPTAQLISEYLGRAIPLPDMNNLRRAFSKIDKMHRYTIGARRGIYRAATKKEGGFEGAISQALGKEGELEAVERGALEMTMDFYMQKVWKPLVLLRLAWPVRVIGEEQLRLAGAGLDSLFSHPLSYISWMTGRGKTGVTKAVQKATGHTVPDEYMELSMSRQSREAMSNRTGGFLDETGHVRMGKAAGARKGYAMYSRGGPRKPYLNAWSARLSELADDPIASAVADDFARTSRRFWDGDLIHVRRQLMKGSARKTKDLGTRAGSDLYLHSLQATIAEATGGSYKVINRRTGQIFRPGIDRTLDAEYVIQAGNPALSRSIGTGMLGSTKVAGIANNSEAKALRAVLGRQHMYKGGAPDQIAGPSWLDSEATNIYDRATDTLFTALMSKPTNFLSRSPAFDQFYWARMEQLAQRMTPQALAKVQKAARAARMGRVFTPERGGVIARLDKMTGVPKGDGIISTMRDADELAKAYALHSTKKLLYDLSTRHRATQIMHNIFPFGEAWVEIFTSWGRLMYRNPQIVQRAGQIVEGARGSGIFYTDPVSNQEVFAYPGGDLIADWMWGKDAPANMRLQGTVQGLNLAAGSVIPGFGPMVQIPAGWFLPDTPSNDGIRRVLLPYGNVTAGSPGGIIDAALPAWMRKVLQAIESPGAKTEMGRLQGNTTIEVLRALLLTGRYNLDTPESAMAAVKAASKKSTILTFVRGMAQFMLPTGPTVAFGVDIPEGMDPEDKDGHLWWFQTISKDYYDRVQNEFEGDEAAAMKWFIGTYGFNPYDVVTPKSQQVYKRHVTQVGDAWARGNQDLFEQFAYPSTAFYAQPDDPKDEFDYQAYVRQLNEGSRVGFTPEQWVVARNQTIGRVQYQRAKDRLGGRTDIYAQQYLSQMRTWLTTQYPGYGLPNVGTAVKPDQKMLMEELQRWDKEPRLANSDTGRALARYLRLMRLAEVSSVRAGYSREGYKTAKGMRNVRALLRLQGERLITQTPDFAGLWMYVLEPQLQDDTIMSADETADTLMTRLTGGDL
jgi:hypothetical protein